MKASFFGPVIFFASQLHIVNYWNFFDTSSDEALNQNVPLFCTDSPTGELHYWGVFVTIVQRMYLLKAFSNQLFFWSRNTS